MGRSGDPRKRHADGDHTDPRRAGGNYAGPGGPQDVGGVVVDTRNAVLLDDVGVVLVGPVRDGQVDDPVLGLTLSGRINKTDERSRVLYLFDEDGAATIASELIGLASRMGPAFRERLLDRIAKLREDDAL